MKKKLFSNWGLKLASLVLAFILWIVVVRIEDPQDTRTFRNVPVKLINTSLLTDADEEQVYEVLEDTNIIKSVTVLARKTVLDQLSASDIVAVADVKNLITYSNTIEISVTIPLYGDQVDSITASNTVMKLNVEDKKNKWVDLKYNLIGEVAAGYMVGNVSLDQNQILISGPESQVAAVDHASLDVDVSGFSTNLSANMEIKLYDADNNPIESRSVEKKVEYAHITVEVLATKEVPVVLTVMGTPADGYIATGVVENEHPNVKIAGSASILNNINQIVIPEEELDITGATGDVGITINLKEYLPDGVRLAQGGFNGRINVTVYIEKEAEKRLTVSSGNISITNVPEGYQVDFAEDTESYELVVKGLEAQVSLLTDAGLKGVVDVTAWMTENGITEIASGTRIIEVDFGLVEDITVVRPVSVRLSFSKPEET